MLTPTESVNRVCYPYDITVWALRVKIPDLEDTLISYLDEVTAYKKNNSLLMSALNYSANTQPIILTEDSQLPVVQCPKLLGIYLNKHSDYVAEKVPSRNNILKAWCCLPTPMTLARRGVQCSRLWFTSQLLRPSGQQCRHPGGVCLQI